MAVVFSSLQNWEGIFAPPYIDRCRGVFSPVSYRVLISPTESGGGAVRFADYGGLWGAKCPWRRMLSGGGDMRSCSMASPQSVHIPNEKEESTARGNSVDNPLPTSYCNYCNSMDRACTLTAN